MLREAQVITYDDGISDVFVRTPCGTFGEDHRVVDVLRPAQLALVLCIRCKAVWIEGGVPPETCDVG